MKTFHAFITLREGEGGQGNRDTITQLPLSHDNLAMAVRDIEDTDENASVFETLAGHPSRRVREEVACMDCLNEATVRALAVDRSVDVIRALVLTDGFATHATEGEVMALIDRDTEVAESVADKLDTYERVNQSAVLHRLFELEDTAVMAALASSDSVPEVMLLQLADHPDPEVRSRARQRLD